MNNEYKRILAAYCVNLFGIVNSLLMNLWIMREVANTISDKEIGLLLACSSTIEYFGLLGSGIAFAVSQRLSEALAVHDLQQARRLYRQVVYFNRVVLAIILIAVTAAVLCIISIERLPDISTSTVATLLAILGANLSFTAVSSAAITALTATQNLHIVHAVRLVGTSLTVFASYLFLRLNIGIASLPLAAMVIGLLQCLVYWQICKIICPWLVGDLIDTWRGFGLTVRRSILLYCAIILSTIEGACESVILYFSSDTPLSDLATYSFWMRVPLLIIGTGSGIISNALPTLSSVATLDKIRAIRIFNKLHLLSTGIAVFALFGVSLWLVPFMHIWLRGEYNLSNGGVVAASAALLVALKIVINGMANVSYPMGCPHHVVLASALLVSIKIVVGVYLTYTYGIVGIIFGWITASLAVYMYYCCVHQKLHIIKFSSMIVTSAILLLAFLVAIPMSSATVHCKIFNYIVLGISCTGFIFFALTYVLFRIVRLR